MATNTRSLACMSVKNSSVDSTVRSIHIVSSYTDKEPTMPHLTLLEWTKNESPQQLRLIDIIAKKWRNLGSAGLGIDEHVLNNLEDKSDDINSCRRVLQKFLENGSPNYKTPSWGNLIEALQKAEMKVVASTLLDALSHL